MSSLNKVAIVTGGAVRIGKTICLSLAKAGYDIALHYQNSAQAADETLHQISELGVKAMSIQADLSKPSEARALLHAVNKQLGDVSVLINSAAVFPENDSLQSAAETDWQLIMGLNLQAPLLLSQAFAEQPCFKTAQGQAQGHIINILDARIKQPAGEHLVYRLSKAGLWHLTESLARELAPNIQVNGLALGAILPPPGADDLHFKRMANHIPLQQTGDPKAVSEAIQFLLSQSFITGAILPIDGGEFL